MIATFILATWLTVVPVPGEQGVYNIISDDMATQSPLSPLTRTADAMLVGDPVPTRNSYSYEDLDQNYPIREVIPRSQRVRQPIEERMYMQQFDNEQRQRELSIRGQELNQTIAARTYEYDQKILNQAEGATQMLGEFDPASPTFDNDFAEFQAQNPLAFQNPAFRQLADRLATTRQQILETGARREGSAAAGGTTSLTAYQEAIKQGKTPFEAQAIATDAQARQQAITAQEQLIERNRQELAMRGGPNAVGAYDDSIRSQQSRANEIRQARAAIERYSPEKLADFDRENPMPQVDPTIALGQASQVTNQKPLTRADYTALLSFNNKAITDADGYENLAPEQKAVVDFNQSQMNRFIEAQGGEPISRPQPSNALQRFNSLIGQ